MNLKQPKVAPDWYGTTYIGVEGYWKIRIDCVGGLIRTARWTVKDADSLNTYIYFNREDAIQKGIDLYNEHVAELLECLIEPKLTSPECASHYSLDSLVEDVKRGLPLGTASNT